VLHAQHPSVEYPWHRLLAWFSRQYLQGTQQCSSAYAEPLHAESLIGMPRTILVTAGLDPLRDEGTAYARRLRDAGTEVTFDCVEGAIYGFLSMPSISPRANCLLGHYITVFRDILHRVGHEGSEDSPPSRSDIITRSTP
jgi:acetyl esterase/lipase